MQINTNSPDKILSLLLDVTQCTFVRITEFKKKKHSRYQYGDVDDVKLLEQIKKTETNYLTTKTKIELGQYHFDFRVLNKHCAHIECKMLIEKNCVNNKRTLVAANDARIDIEIVNNVELPSFIIQLSKFHNKNLGAEASIKYSDDESKWLSTIMLKTLYATIKNLQLIEHYQQLTSDSLTKLRSRTALQRGIDEQIVQAGVALCMIHCIDFQHVNRKFGQAKGDTVLHEIASVIEKYTRDDDVSGRFGGALFGISIHAKSVEDGYTLANKLQAALNNMAYLQNAIRLNFNVGVAYVSQEEDQLDNSSTSSLLINRTEQALKAAQNSPNPSIVQWEPDKFRLDEQEFNYLGGIFTPDNVTNYRNMLLLWDISSIIADEHTFESLLKNVIERLAFTFEFAFAGIVGIADTSEKKTHTHNYSFELANATDIVEIEWDSHQYKSLVEDAAKRSLENSQHIEHQEDDLNALVIPLGNETNKCFFIMGHNELLDLTHDTVMLFVGFARQLGKAFKRSQLEDQLNKNLEKQNAQLSQELLELKAGMQSSALVYRSAKMQKIVQQTQRAAQTDATVLITGESGTGKEKLINAIHLLSPRSKQPLVIVDCGSIPETLIEAELFGHIKGAFTGAQNDSKGKIQTANGGILVLDEIGELPLSMQPKLLRFVQEKQYTPVGGNKPNVADVKIVAVTNRDLPFEVSQGKFRKDLYYRLNVVSLHNPPLRERIEDIDLLCQHFLSKFARQFEMDKKRLSQLTINTMKEYSWPGNIRELENKLMQASLLTIDEEITFADLNLDLTTSNNVPAKQTNAFTSSDTVSNNDTFTPQSKDISALQDLNIHHQNGRISTATEAWCHEFSETLNKLLDDIDMHTILNFSLGSSIESMLLSMAHAEHKTHAKTAVAMQIPISTARRRLLKPPPEISMFENNPNWHKLINLFSQIVNNELVLRTPVELTRNLIAQCILNLHSSNMALASQLMGVSEPTMYKLRKQITSGI